MTLSARHLSPVNVLALVLASSLPVTSADLTIAKGSPGAVQFDAIMEAKQPLAKGSQALFLRYWASASNYSLAVIWAEPQRRRFSFPLYPPGLVVNSTPEAFHIEHMYFPSLGSSHAKPAGERGAFEYLFGDYGIEGLRFFEDGAVKKRMPVELISPSSAGSQVLWPWLGKSGGFRQTIDDNQLKSVEVLGQELGILGECRYVYCPKTSRLEREEVLVPERRVQVGFRGKGAGISIGSTNKQYVKTFPLAYLSGGRSNVVKFQEFDLGGQTTRTLPASVEVWHAASNSLLQSVSFSQYGLLASSPEAWWAEARQAATPPAWLLEAGALARKYRAYPPVAVEGVDSSRIAWLRGVIGDRSHAGTPVERLRATSTLLGITILADAPDAVGAVYQDYCRLLLDQGLKSLLLVGGTTVMEWCTVSGRFAEADVVLELWLCQALAQCTAGECLTFAEQELRSGNYWALISLLEKIPSSPDTEREHRRQFARLAVLNSVNKLIAGRASTVDPYALAQLAWVNAHATPGEITNWVNDAEIRLKLSRTVGK